jgi:hypothetical protein
MLGTRSGVVEPGGLTEFSCVLTKSCDDFWVAATGGLLADKFAGTLVPALHNVKPPDQSQ